MKRHVKKMGLTLLWSLVFIIGSMVLVGDLQAQNLNSQLVLNAPNGKSWVTPQQAKLTVQSEISLLTTQLLQLIQQGGDEALIIQKKAELQYYMLVEEGLNAGYPVWKALQVALDSLGGTDGDKGSPGNIPQVLQVIFDKSVLKLVN